MCRPPILSSGVVGIDLLFADSSGLTLHCIRDPLKTATAPAGREPLLLAVRSGGACRRHGCALCLAVYCEGRSCCEKPVVFTERSMGVLGGRYCGPNVKFVSNV
jgi:hypothetical protein